MFLAPHSTLMGHNVLSVFYVVTMGDGEMISKDISIARVFWNVPLIKALYSFHDTYKYMCAYFLMHKTGKNIILKYLCITHLNL